MGKKTTGVRDSNCHYTQRIYNYEQQGNDLELSSSPQAAAIHRGDNLSSLSLSISRLLSSLSLTLPYHYHSNHHTTMINHASLNDCHSCLYTSASFKTIYSYNPHKGTFWLLTNIVFRIGSDQFFILVHHLKLFTDITPTRAHSNYWQI